MMNQKPRKLNFESNITSFISIVFCSFQRQKKGDIGNIERLSNLKSL